jgi:hypothetical protein
MVTAITTAKSKHEKTTGLDSILWKMATPDRTSSMPEAAQNIFL